jgi:hypothetical protein
VFFAIDRNVTLLPRGVFGQCNEYSIGFFLFEECREVDDFWHRVNLIRYGLIEKENPYHKNKEKKEAIKLLFSL